MPAGRWDGAVRRATGSHRVHEAEKEERVSQGLPLALGPCQRLCRGRQTMTLAGIAPVSWHQVWHGSHGTEGTGGMAVIWRGGGGTGCRWHQGGAGTPLPWPEWHKVAVGACPCPILGCSQLHLSRSFMHRAGQGSSGPAARAGSHISLYSKGQERRERPGAG